MYSTKYSLNFTILPKSMFIGTDACKLSQHYKYYWMIQ